MTIREVAVKESTCIGNGVTEMGRTPVPHCLPLALKRARYLFTAG